MARRAALPWRTHSYGGRLFGWSGVATVHNKQEWPDWYPTKEILQRKPEIESALARISHTIFA